MTKDGASRRETLGKGSAGGCVFASFTALLSFSIFVTRSSLSGMNLNSCKSLMTLICLNKLSTPLLRPLLPSQAPFSSLSHFISHLPPLFFLSPPVCNQGCEVSGRRKCSHISKGSWVLSGSGQEKEKVKLNTVGEERGMRAAETSD